MIGSLYDFNNITDVPALTNKPARIQNLNLGKAILGIDSDPKIPIKVGIDAQYPARSTPSPRVWRISYIQLDKP